MVSLTQYYPFPKIYECQRTLRETRGDDIKIPQNTARRNFPREALTASL